MGGGSSNMVLGLWGGITGWCGDRCAGLMVLMMTHSVITCELLLEGAWPRVSGSPPWGAGRLLHPLDPPTIPTFRGTLRAQRNISLMLFLWKYLDFFWHQLFFAQHQSCSQRGHAPCLYAPPTSAPAGFHCHKTARDFPHRLARDCSLINRR